MFAQTLYIIYYIVIHSVLKVTMSAFDCIGICCTVGANRKGYRAIFTIIQLAYSNNNTTGAGKSFNNPDFEEVK